MGRRSRRRPQAAVEAAREIAEARGVSDPERVLDHVFYDGEMQKLGGQWTHGYRAPRSHEEPKPEGQRINMVTAIRRTLDHELEINPRVLLFGEDIGPKGGVHAVTLGLQEKYGAERVFDTSLNEEGHHRPRGRHGARRADAGARDPVPQICRARHRADQRLRDDALAHPQPLRRADGAADPRRLLQVRRPLAQPDQRGAVRPQSGLAGGGAVQRRGCGRAAPDRASGQRSGRLLRASRDARRQPGRAGPIPATTMCFRSGGRRRCARATTSPSSPGARWCRAARRRRRRSRPTSSTSGR